MGSLCCCAENRWEGRQESKETKEEAPTTTIRQSTGERMGAWPPEEVGMGAWPLEEVKMGAWPLEEVK